MRQTPAIHRLAGAHSRRLRRFASTLGALACLSVIGLGLSAAPAIAEDCPNAALRAANNSTRLPECRAYEMVTPLYKEGFVVEPRGYTDDGIISYQSIGSFAGNPTGTVPSLYHATRSVSGWTTTALEPPGDTYTGFPFGGILIWGESVDLRRSLFIMSRRDLPGDAMAFYVGGPGGTFTRIGDTGGGGAATLTVSADLSHVVFEHFTGGDDALNEYVGTGNQGAPRPVSVDNTGTPTPGQTCPGPMSADGRVMSFSSGCNGGMLAVWARLGGSTTVAVSASECTRTSSDPGGACNATAAANLEGAASDGSRVYFTSTQQLVNADIDQSNDLYECEIPPGVPAPVGTANSCASLTEVSGATSGADVQNVVHITEDGSRVYFVAQGVLAANLGTNDAAPVAGDNNLYVWQKDAAHPAGQMTFVAKLEVNDISRAQSTPDDRYLIFNSSSRLLASDTDEATDVYRYDADTGSLLRLSTDTNGSGGNEPGAQASVATGARNRHRSAMTDDASTVVFDTSEALSPADTDGITDVYAWHDGQVSLISSGGGGAIGITRSGQDIFFGTNQPLTPGDSGTEGDIYDAHIDGGFPVSTSVPCSGEACQGTTPLQPQPPGTSASAAFNGPGNPVAAETPPASQPKPKPQTAAQKLAKALKACKAKHSKKKRTACEKRARNTYRRAK